MDPVAAVEGPPAAAPASWLDQLIRFCLEQKLVVVLLVAFTVLWGLRVAPFEWELPWLPRDPVPVDAIPDIGENQQIVFTEWPGRSAEDVEDQVSYPLTVGLLGIPGVKTIRTTSMFGFSTVFVIFEEAVDFYWSRSRILEKLSSLPPGTLPPGVEPSLGPDATALGQVFWYGLEGRDPAGKPTGGWGLEELRSIQDWTVRYALLSAEGVSEVASVGGFVRELQVDVDPDALRAFGVTLDEVQTAVRGSNLDVGARSLELNRVEYVIRGLGFLKSVADVEDSVVAVRDRTPVYVKNVARVTEGPALRRGALDREGAETAGGVVVVRYGANPLASIASLKERIATISAGLPRKTLPDGTVSQVTIVPFYDRSGLIRETLATLDDALFEEILVTVIVILLSVWHFRSALLISALLPLAVLMCFIAMRVAGIDANIVALSGIAIAIGTMVDMGIVLCESVLRGLEEAGPDEDRLEVVYRAASEVGSAVLTAVATTVASFLPILTMEAAEGKLFRPLAWTKTFALLASVVVALVIIPPAAHLLFTGGARKPSRRDAEGPGGSPWLLRLAGLAGPLGILGSLFVNLSALALVVVALSRHWSPLGADRGLGPNLVFVAGLLFGIMAAFALFERLYPRLLAAALDRKLLALAPPALVVLVGASTWLGFARVGEPFLRVVAWSGLDDSSVRMHPWWSRLVHAFPGLGKEFMPPLDEGSYLYMPTTMAHAGMEEAQELLALLDAAIATVPEVESAVGKLGRAESALDPAPISMFETVVNYLPEYRVDDQGRRLYFAWDDEAGDFARDRDGALIPDPAGRPFRNWRPQIRKPDDIWTEILAAARIPGLTSAPRLQPIAARTVMLQSGMRAPMGIKVRGPDLATIEAFGLELERLLRQIPSVEPAAVFADRIVGKPYLEIEIDRRAIARYGIPIRAVQDVIEGAIGGGIATTTVEGRERYPVRVRYLRELRDSPEALERILVPGRDGVQVPLGELSTVRYVRGPEMIRSEDTFLVGYVLFDMRPGHAEVDVVESARKVIDGEIAAGRLTVPAGVSWIFAGSYENQVRSEKRLRVVLPVSLFLIFLLLYLQFRAVTTSLLVFSGIVVCWGGGFCMLWLYQQPWFLDVEVMGTNLRTLFQVGPVNLSVAVWVGFLALFGIASDDGVVIATYLDQSFAARRPGDVAGIRAAVLEAGCRRIRPCLMTTTTTMLALIPVLTSDGRGSDILLPMAIPGFGGMLVELNGVFVVPVLYCAREEWKLWWREPWPAGTGPTPAPGPIEAGSGGDGPAGAPSVPPAARRPDPHPVPLPRHLARRLRVLARRFPRRSR